MFDSIKCHAELNIDVNLFPHKRYVHDSRNGIYARHWLTEDGIHLNYRVDMVGARGVLSIEVALSQWTGIPRTFNPTMEDYQYAINRINKWIRDKMGITVDIRDWTVTRIDYCYNFDVSDARDYLLMLKTMHCGTLTRQMYEGGVVWKNDSRWVKFYDKQAQLGYDNHDVLRYEVSNHKGAVAYMCKHWFGCARVLRELLHPMRALYVLARSWHELGLNVDSYTTDIALLSALRATFPDRTHTAYGVVHLMRVYGTDCITSGFVPRSTYYRWRRLLRTHHLLPIPTLTLPVLRFPSTFFTQQHSQNLGKSLSAPHISTKKIGENFWIGDTGLKIELPEWLHVET